MLALADVLAQLPPDVRPLFGDAGVSEVMLNPDGSVWREVDGVVSRVRGVEVGRRELEAAAMAIARPLNSDAAAGSPPLDARLPDGSRVAICCPPVAEAHAVTVRRFPVRRSLDDLVGAGALEEGAAAAVLEALAGGRNVLISGGTGSGKTTLLGALAGRLGGGERVVVIEDTRELAIEAPNILRLEAQRGSDEREEVTVRDLVRHALRHRPDRLIVGEVRGGEALDLLQALNTGHGGSLCTIHARSAQKAPGRLAACAAQAGAELPWDVLCTMVGEAVDVVLHVARDGATGRREVRGCDELKGYEAGGRGWVWGGSLGGAGGGRPRRKRPAR